MQSSYGTVIKGPAAVVVADILSVFTDVRAKSNENGERERCVLGVLSVLGDSL